MHDRKAFPNIVQPRVSGSFCQHALFNIHAQRAFCAQKQRRDRQYPAAAAHVQHTLAAFDVPLQKPQAQRCCNILAGAESAAGVDSQQNVAFAALAAFPCGAKQQMLADAVGLMLPLPVVFPICSGKAAAFERESDIITGTVERVENRNVFIDLGKTEAVLTPTEQIAGEVYEHGDRIKAYILEVRRTSKGPQIMVSRTHPGLLKRLFELEVPEIQEGVVEIKSVAREPGMRSKIAVYSREEDVDPVGACVGHKGLRVQAIVDELRNEKIDIVKWNADSARYIANALSPAKVVSVAVNEDEKFSRVIVPDYQLSLAIGKEGQNARLAAKLTGWKIDIKSESQAADEEPDDMMDIVEVTSEESFSAEGDAE